ncbi:MAG: helix-turn-helix transcriptional regulator [Muribaculaceae bacterium]|nr:helix-turn-helix transcriptional regulator [Muribaculaceae bacterium]
MDTLKDKIKKISRPATEEMQNKRERRRKERELIAASTAIAAKIVRAMRVKEMKNSELAEALGVAPGNITRYLSGKVNFELKTLIALEKVLEISLINKDFISENQIHKPTVKVLVIESFFRPKEIDWKEPFEVTSDVTDSGYKEPADFKNHLDYYEHE